MDHYIEIKTAFECRNCRREAELTHKVALHVSTLHRRGDLVIEDHQSYILNTSPEGWFSVDYCSKSCYDHHRD